jgi:hypothetical protein
VNPNIVLYVDENRIRPASVPVKAGLILLMVLGSVALWIGDPLLWMWITSRLESGTQAKMGPYGLMVLGIILTAVVVGKALQRLNRLYADVTGTSSTVRIPLPWRRSLRDARHGGQDEEAHVPVSLLDVVMVISVVIAVAALVTWFVIVEPAPSFLPGGPGPAKD